MRQALGLMIACLLNAVAWGQTPQVLDSIPRNGDLQVDPQLGWMVFAFDRDMATTYSFCGGGPTFPKVGEMPRWLDARLLVVKVRLEPDHEYQFALNCLGFQGFRDLLGRPLESYPIMFRTGGAAPPLTAEINTQALEALRRAIDEEYSYRDLRGIDWPGLFAQYGPALVQARTPGQFADVAAMLLSQAKDIHITMMAGGEIVPTFARQVDLNLNAALLSQIVLDFHQPSPAVCTGRFPDGIRYVLITTWSQESAAALDEVYPVLWEAAGGPGLIVDVRPNAGGAETLALQMAGCFVEEPHVYAKHLLRSATSPGGFTSPVDRVLLPNEKRPRYRGPTVVLMGQANASSCESFLLMMKQIPGCTLMGEKSYGASGNPLPHDLGNGVTVLLPSWKALRPDGTCFENEGIEPDIAIHVRTEQLAMADPVLEAALVWLRSYER